ncbi:MAG: DNA mismatch repair endonuclease MutL [Candidatus Pseudoruminococcus sp.]|nr:DNA mismatch repair endonuclease MutL [Ruminococcus sp.]MDY2782365.1 DNA mismatch repair endonuclease MutL [Candidatus Pseudoruminococcus sp.]
MGVIKLLDKHMSELIAAGEVIERPSSVIKELVENSIDSGAKHITVEIQHGGITFMRVTDDGCGISREDIPTAFLRHATSKVHEKQDLDAIGTLGFRGEALASIAAVAKVTMLSCRENEDIGTRYEIHGGDEIEIDDAGCPKGTTIIARDIFYNVPARMKFLKKDVSEANSVSGVMDRIALSHPEISFTFIRDGKQTMKTPGDDNLKNAILSVFGKDFTSTLIPLNYQHEGIKIQGYITRPISSRANRSMQLFFINGRYIKTRTAMAALEEAYKGNIMTGKFPGCVLHMTMDCSTLDVNVHPSKLEVRFTNERPIFDAVYHGVKSALLSGDNRSPIKEEEPLKPEILEKTATKIENEQLQFIYQPKEVKPVEKSEKISEKDSVLKEDLKKEFVQKNVELDNLEESKSEPEIFMPKPSNFSPMIVSDCITVDPYTASVRKKLEKATAETDGENEEKETQVKTVKEDEEKFSEPTISQKDNEPFVVKNQDKLIDSFLSIAGVRLDSERDAPMKFLGEAFATYIILEKGNAILFIDKHAAHERLLYEKLKRDCGKNYAQILLEPITVTLDKTEYDALLNNLSAMEDAGFEIDDYGMGTVVVRAAPQIVERDDIADTVVEMAGYLAKNKRDIMTEKMDWLYKNVACRAAIKAGDRSSEGELMALVEELMKNPDVKYCPHGRPICFTMTRHELEKRFMRV